MTRYHQVSGGAQSWLMVKVDMERRPGDEHRFVFADTLYEDADCYRFLLEGICYLLGRPADWVPRASEFPEYRVPAETAIEDYHGNPEWRAFLAGLREAAAALLPELTWLVEGRDPWEIFRDRKFLGNSQKDPCSLYLKRSVIDAWRDRNCKPELDVFCVGISVYERHRYDALAKRQADKGWTYAAPLIDEAMRDPLMADPVYWIMRAGLTLPRLYRLGYVHNNCGGFCIKAGQAHYIDRLRTQPERFYYDAMMEAKLALYLGKPVSMLTDRRGDGKKKILTLSELAEWYESLPDAPVLDMLEGEAGCGCMIDG